MRERDNSFYEKIGIDFEFPSLYEKLTARENLQFFASLYENRGKEAREKRMEELLEQVGLLRDADKKVSDFSKGMKSRLNFIKALLHNPDILFLDEPTSGLDPTNSRLMKDMIITEKQKGKTIIITTHNMEDAAELCDRVAFIVEGKIKALDSPHHLIMEKGTNKLHYSYLNNGAEVTDQCLLKETGQNVQLQNLMWEGKILTIHSEEPNLGDIFMEVTGRRLA